MAPREANNGLQGIWKYATNATMAGGVLAMFSWILWWGTGFMERTIDRTEKIEAYSREMSGGVLQAVNAAKDAGDTLRLIHAEQSRSTQRMETMMAESRTANAGMRDMLIENRKVLDYLADTIRRLSAKMEPEEIR